MENKQTPQLVQDRKTGKWYDPVVEFEKVLNSEWFKKIMQNLKNR
jgi:hypothetical protein